jgi:hypothetical protein
MVHIHLLLILYVLTALLQKRATLLHKCMRLLFLALGTAEELLLGRVWRFVWRAQLDALRLALMIQRLATVEVDVAGVEEVSLALLKLLICRRATASQSLFKVLSCDAHWT